MGQTAVDEEKKHAAAAEGGRQAPKCKLDTASWLQIGTLSWVSPLMKFGYEAPLMMDDMLRWGQPEQYNATKLRGEFWDVYCEEKHTLRTIARLYWKRLVVATFVLFCNRLTSFGWPYLIQAFVQLLLDPEQELYWGFVYVGLLGMLQILNSVFINIYFYLVTGYGSQVRSACLTSVYAKSMRLSSKARDDFNTGEMIAFMSADCNNIFFSIQYCCFLVNDPLIMMLALVLLYIEIGPASLVAAFMMFLLAPSQVLAAKLIQSARKSMLAETDVRIALTSEILQGIRVLKFYAWELPMLDKVLGSRLAQLGHLFRMILLSRSNIAFMFAWPVISAAATFAALGFETLDITKVVTTLTFLAIWTRPLTGFPVSLKHVASALPSFRRLDRLFEAAELQDREAYDKAWVAARSSSSSSSADVAAPEAAAVASENDEEPLLHLSVTSPEDVTLQQGNIPQGICILVEKGTFSWGGPNGAPTLHDIDLCIPKGSLVGVIGKVGSGKSSLHSALLGEMFQLSGRSQIVGSIAYVDQQAWILNTTLRENVLFGAPFDNTWYWKVLDVCALLDDLKVLPDGDMTEIGELGINLSGGQKARISLARAVYRQRYDVNCYLLDDPLSAVDAHVAKHIFEKCIRDTLADKTRLLSLNSHIHFLQECDFVIVMEDGAIASLGKYEEIASKHAGLMHALQESEAKQQGVESGGESPALRQRAVSVRSRASSAASSHKSHAERTPMVLIGDEARETGSVGVDVYRYYFDAAITSVPKAEKLFGSDKSVADSVLWKCCGIRGGWFVMAQVLFMFLLVQTVRVGCDFWILVIADQDATELDDVMDDVYVYIGFIAGLFLFMIIRATRFTSICVRASRVLHDRLLFRILRAPVPTFFDVTPVGRLTNLVSQDMDLVDGLLPDFMGNLLQQSFILLSTFVLASIAMPWFLLLMIPIFFVFFRIQRYYRASSRELKRLESISRSPVYSHFQSTLNGLPSIRAYHKAQDFIDHSAMLIDHNNINHFMFHFAGRWLAIRLDGISACILMSIGCFALLLRDQIDPRLVGLSLLYSIQLTGFLQWTVRLGVECENAMTSVERIQEGSGVPQEAPYSLNKDLTSSGWPQKGAIKFQDVSMRYRPQLPLVLRGVSADIQAHEKIGICGRTGSGKSSLIASLFRTSEYEPGGVIRIDGVDIREIGLGTLRSAVGIIPQMPTLFTGTIRSNLDPFMSYSDEELWESLRFCSMADVVEALPGELTAPVVEFGENFSQGERQLLTVARALLRKPTMLVLDEATASIDMKTDQLIQQSIRTNFKGNTVLTIAHRLDTILHCDRIMVLSEGRVAEFGPPAELAQTEGSIFAGLLSHSNLGLSDIERAQLPEQEEKKQQ